MKRHLVAATAALGLFAPFATSADFSYDYVEGGLAVYPDYRFSGGAFRGEDFVGVRVGASFSITEEVFTFGQLRYLTDDIDMTTFHWGGGYILPLALPDSFNVWVGGALEYIDVDFPGGRENEPGLSLRTGGRYAINPAVEVGADVRVIRYGGDIGETISGVTGRGVYFFNGNVGLVGELDIEDGEHGVFFGARITF